jgi:hypothetical protein
LQVADNNLSAAVLVNEKRKRFLSELVVLVFE